MDNKQSNVGSGEKSARMILYCIHQWSPPVNAGLVEMKHCKFCDAWWASGDDGFADEPQVALMRAE